MKKLLSPAIVVAVSMFIFLAVGTASAQKVGGYRSTLAAAADVKAAAAFAVSAQAEKTDAEITLHQILKAEKQVVSGTNYRLCLMVMDGDDMYNVTAVIYQDLKQNYALTSWTKANCGGSE